MTAEIAKIIEDGLKWYEEELWHDRPKPNLEKTVIIRNQRKINTNEKNAESKDTKGKNSLIKN